MHSDDGEGVGIGTMIRKANVSYSRAADILQELVRVGLLVEVNEGRKTRYTLTDDGYRYLAEYKTFAEYTRPLGLRL